MLCLVKDVKSFQPKAASGDKCKKKGGKQGDKWDSVKSFGQGCLSREQAKRQAETV